MLEKGQLFDIKEVKQHYTTTYEVIRKFKRNFEKLSEFHSVETFSDELIKALDIHSSIESVDKLPLNESDILWEIPKQQKGKSRTWNDFWIVSISDTDFSPSKATYRTYFKIDSKPTTAAKSFGLCGVFGLEDIDLPGLNSRMIDNKFGENYLAIEAFCRANIPERNVEMGDFADSREGRVMALKDPTLDEPEDNSPQAVDQLMREVVENPTREEFVKAFIRNILRSVRVWEPKLFLTWLWFIDENNWSEDCDYYETNDDQALRDAASTMNVIRCYSQGIDVPRIIDELFKSED